MRHLVCLAACVAILVVTSPARAETFLDLEGGISIPMGDSDWTDSAESSPKLGLRIGAFPHEIGGFIAADWTPVNTDTQGWSVPGASGDISAHRFRLLGGAMVHHNLSNTLAVTGHAGIGTDIAHASYTVTILGNSSTRSDTDAGLAVELGAGAWFRLGSMEVGGEVNFPIGTHDHDAGNDGIGFHYTSYDLELLGGIRFLSH